MNSYLAHKQHLLPASQVTDVVQATRDIVALHATDPIGPYLSLWARVPDFQREALEDALYEQRTLAKMLCMRVTLHAVPSDEVGLFFQAYSAHRTRPEVRTFGDFLVQAGLCQEEETDAYLRDLQRRVLDVLAEKGPSTVRQINQAVPELKTKIRHSVGKAYEGEFSVGSYLVPNIMGAQGLLIRARPRGTWRSNLYEYAALSDWLPDVDLESVTPQDARVWLVRRYLAAFGPATLDDVQWWTGFTKGETEEALEGLKQEAVEMELDIGDSGAGYLMLADDAQRLRSFTPPETPYAFFLPSLDPYIMGYRDRRRFLAAEHHAQVFDRAGNAVPTVWVNGRVVGAWGQRKDGTVIYGLFGPVGAEERALLQSRRQQLEGFLGGEYLPPRFRTPFTRALE
ncbi:MAG: hypothetical protein GWM88_09645 [Pseudomonadales bacterium]|nr:winged helix DNA-binding domain-containing protein [Pseudomonadales bacterium]NIX08253.1 hypothetical protein [Pseudomonadales bacterium]